MGYKPPNGWLAERCVRCTDQTHNGLRPIWLFTLIYLFKDSISGISTAASNDLFHYPNIRLLCLISCNNLAQSDHQSRGLEIVLYMDKTVNSNVEAKSKSQAFCFFNPQKNDWSKSAIIKTYVDKLSTNCPTISHSRWLRIRIESFTQNVWWIFVYSEQQHHLQ